MMTKSETTDFLKFLHTQLQSGKISETNDNTFFETDKLIDIIRSTPDENVIYCELGQFMTESDIPILFQNICFREDCCEYLINCGFENDEAYKLTEVIRKGQYRFERFQINSSALTDEFYNWAKIVKYLPSRKTIFDIFANNYTKFLKAKGEF